LRTMDTAARIGGEEFAVILPNTKIEEGAKVAEKLRERIESRAEVGTNGSAVKATISLGVGVYNRDHSILKQPSALKAVADKALYHSKGSGRNCVTVARKYQRKIHFNTMRAVSPQRLPN